MSPQPQHQKWTTEEEEAFIAGVEKHGSGKWKRILNDSEFASTLANRMDFKLKSKWRTLAQRYVPKNREMDDLIHPQKQKWTTEEEEALHAGVEKHGSGKWKVILSDSEFASSLANRSSDDLKMKWWYLGKRSGVPYNTTKVRTCRLDDLMHLHPHSTKKDVKKE